MNEIKKEDIILDDMYEIKDEIMEDIHTIIDAEWNAPIIQKDIQEKITTYRKLQSEFSNLYEKNSRGRKK